MKRFSNGLIAILIATVFMGIIALPDSVKQSMPDNAVTNWIKSKKVTLGLDLQGGIQLDYRVDLKNAISRNEDSDTSNDIAIKDIIHGVLATLERRVNGLGVSEPQIYTSNIAGEDHIIVELAGIKDINEAKAVVGKTIQLEFMEPKTEVDPKEEATLMNNVNSTLEKALKPDADFATIGEDVKTSNGSVRFEATKESFETELPAYYASVLPNLKANTVYKDVIDGSGEYTRGSNGEIKEIKTKRLVKLIKSDVKDKTETTEEKVRASHILIAYSGAERAPSTITRTKEEAKARAEEALKAVQSDPTNFASVAEKYSDDPTAKGKGGDLDFFGKGAMTKSFEDAAFGMEVGGISEIVETPFGYHIIKVTDKQAASETVRKENSYTYSEILFDTTPNPWKPTGLDGSQFKYASVTYTQIGTPQVTIQFTGEGADLFEKLTDRLTGSQIAIFVGGELVSAPTVNQKITGGNAVITGNFTLQRALQLANDLNTGAIDAPIILSGQHNISATLGESALSVSILAGIIGLIGLTLFMILYYRMLGVFAILALLIYSTIIIFILKTTPIVMTLAGIAGIILSIGMAVDANILIFERTKEELLEGKNFSASITTGFERAWSSIRDSNASSLITCVILWFFGNSIIRGFALMLGIGIVVSMFTAINVTRTFLHTITGT